MGPHLCENNESVYQLIFVMMHKKLSEIDQRFSYLGKVPWLFSKMDETESAMEIIRQCSATPLEQHDPLVRNVMGRLGGDILAVSRGEPATPEVIAEAKVFRYCSLDESCGEEYHARTHREKKRAPASSTTHLKQSTRHRPALARAQDLCSQYGERGEAVVRSDWRDWKRIVQVRPKTPWIPVDWPAQKVIDRVYRQDEKAQDDFELICRRIGPDRPVEPDPTTGGEAVRNEFLHIVMETANHYSVGSRPVAPAPGGIGPAPRPDYGTSHFLLLDEAYGRSRPKVVHTHETADEVYLKAPLAWRVLFHDRWAPGDEVLPADADSRMVIPSGEPRWVTPADIATDDVLGSALFRWEGGYSNEHHCQLLPHPQILKKKKTATNGCKLPNPCPWPCSKAERLDSRRQKGRPCSDCPWRI